MLANNSLIRDSFDATAQAYINAVESADGQALEAEVARAITRFVKGCKIDGTWTAIKACCILAGAKTLAGALVPLVGAAPTSFNFVSADYARKTGLKGNGTNKYLDSNRAGGSEPQNSLHQAVWITQLHSGATGFYLGNGNGTNTTGMSHLGHDGTNHYARNRSSTSSGNFTPNVGFLGSSRSVSGSFTFRVNGGNNTVTATSQSTTWQDHHVFALLASGASPTNARLSFYSIGENLNLALLDTRVSALMTAFNRYIP